MRVQDLSGEAVGERGASDEDRRAVPTDQMILEAITGLAIVVTDRDGTVVRWNAGAERILGWPAETVLGSSVDAVLAPEDLGRVRANMARALEAGRIVDERWQIKRDGTRFRAFVETTPIGPSGGDVLGFVTVLRDRTDEHLLELRLDEAAERQRLAVGLGRIGVFDLDIASGELTWDERAREAFGVRPGRVVTTQSDMSAVHADDKPIFERALAVAMNGEPFDLRFRVVGIDDRQTRWVAMQGRVLGSRAGAGRFVGVVRDVSAEVAAENRRSLLNRELSHRLKNTLSIVQSIVTQTLRTASDLPSARLSLGQRIQTLSKAHDLLVAGRRDAGSLGAIVLAAVEVHDPEQRIAAEGPELAIGPRAAMTLALVMHELATNAAKYGALSVPEGRVQVRWTVREGDAAQGATVRLDWIEIDGPPAVEPTRRGFGTRLIAMGLAGAAQGATELRYGPEGFRCRLQAPLAELQAEDET